jgi:hypothetical protein
VVILEAKGKRLKIEGILHIYIYTCIIQINKTQDLPIYKGFEEIKMKTVIYKQNKQITTPNKTTTKNNEKTNIIKQQK